MAALARLGEAEREIAWASSQSRRAARRWWWPVLVTAVALPPPTVHSKEKAPKEQWGLKSFRESRLLRAAPCRGSHQRASAQLRDSAWKIIGALHNSSPGARRWQPTAWAWLDTRSTCQGCASNGGARPRGGSATGSGRPATDRASRLCRGGRAMTLPEEECAFYFAAMAQLGPEQRPGLHRAGREYLGRLFAVL